MLKNLDPLLVLYFVFGLVLLYLFGWILTVKLRLFFKLAFNSLVGMLLFIVLKYLGVITEITPLYAVLAGTLGVPGAIAAVLISKLL